jgi:hypothetical protein
MAGALRAVGRDWTNSIVSTKITEAKKINALLWGPTGGGKTHFIGTIPNVFGIWCEDGTLTLGGQNIPGYHLAEGDKVYDTMMAIAQTVRNNEGIFQEIDAIAIDSVWKLNQLLMDEIMKENNTPMRIQDWGTLRTRIGAIINQFLSIDKHFFGTLGETTKENELTKSLEPVFNMNGGYAGQIDYEFDFLLYVRGETRGPKTYYRAYTKPVEGRKAKSRIELPQYFDDPTFDMLWTKIQEKGAK